jgi:aspartate ammonia-lyase
MPHISMSRCIVLVVLFSNAKSIELLATASTNVATKCIDGITANKAWCNSVIEESLAICTALPPETGYEAAAKLAKQPTSPRRPCGRWRQSRKSSLRSAFELLIPGT